MCTWFKYNFVKPLIRQSKAFCSSSTCKPYSSTCIFGFFVNKYFLGERLLNPKIFLGSGYIFFPSIAFKYSFLCSSSTSSCCKVSRALRIGKLPNWDWEIYVLGGVWYPYRRVLTGLTIFWSSEFSW